MKRTKLRVLSAFLAFIMVFLMVPFGIINVAAADINGITQYDELDLLGKGYNLLGSQALSSSTLSGSSSIFNENIMNVDGVYSSRLNGGNTSSYSYTYVKDMNSYLRKQSNSLNVNLGMSSKIKLFSMEAKAKMGITENSEISGSTQMEYAILKASQKISTSNIDLNGTYRLQAVWNSNAIDSTFATEARNLFGEVTVEEFIARYGTHIVTGYSTGGEAVVTYSGQDISSAFSNSVKTEEELSLKAGLTGLIDLEGNIKSVSENSNSGSSSNTDISVYGNAYGGSKALEGSFSSGGFSVDAVNDYFESITYENSEILIDESLKLLPIWDLLLASGDAQLITAGQELKKYYDTAVESQCKTFYNDYLNSEYVPDVADNDVDEWTKIDDIKIITTAEEFYNIRNDLSASYVLANNIDLSGYENWIPIGTEEYPFVGTLYGNHNTVSGITLSNTSGQYLGLFGYNSGTIKNLKVSGTITATASADTFIGGIAAYNRGTIQNCYDDITYNVDYANISDINLPLREINLATIGSQTITIGDEIGVRLVGTAGTTYTGVNIVVENNGVDSPAYIVLENANIVGDSANGTLYSNNDRPIYVISTGSKNTIAGKTSCPAVNVPNASVTFFGDAELYVQGGSGTNGSKGYDTAASSQARAGDGTSGTNGAIAMICKSLNVNSTKLITIVGGNGGNGGNGGDVTGTAKLDGYAQLANGGNGGNGGHGGKPIETTALNIINCQNILLQYGNGGAAGNGGHGGDAGFNDGQKPDHGGDGGNGGKGGNGYNSGNGGNGGKGGYSFGTKNALDKRRGQAGDGGDAGNSGNSITAILITNNTATSVLGTIGTEGTKGSAGDRGTDDGVTANAGTDGNSASAGTVDNAFYDSRSTIIVYQYTSSSQLLLQGIISGYNYNSIVYINRNTWNDNILQIDSVTKTEYFSGDDFDVSSVRVLSYDKVVSDYTYVMNTNCSDSVSERIGFVKILRDDCERYVPVHITKTVPIAISIEEVQPVEFVINTVFDISGLTLKVDYNNGDVEYIDENNMYLSYTEPSMDHIGTQTITLSYDYDFNQSTAPLTCSYNINIVRASIVEISIIQSPDTTIYNQGDALNPYGIKVKKLMNNGLDEEIPIEQLKFTVNPSMCTVGTSLVTVSYAGFSDTYTITINENPDFDHSWNDGVITKSATHTEKGSMTYTCTVANCGATKTAEIPTLEGHTYGKWYQLNETQHQRICECGDTTEAVHNWDSGNIVEEPTHTEQGLMSHTCLDCQATKTEIINPTPEHTFSDTWTNFDEVQHYRTCACGEKEYQDHAWDDGIVSVEPTYTEYGTTTYSCTVCSATKSENNIPPNPTEDAPTILIDSKPIVVGKTVTVNITLKNNPGIASMNLLLEYDTSVLTLTDVMFNSEMGGMSQQPQTMASPVNLNWFNGTANTYGELVFVTLVFDISESATVGETTKLSVTYDKENIYDITETNIDFYVDGGELSIVDYTPGDINGDGEVNNKDVTRLFQYLSGWEVEVNEAALNVNGDEAVNNKDLTRLFQYMSGWDVELY